MLDPYRVLLSLGELARPVGGAAVPHHPADPPLAGCDALDLPAGQPADPEDEAPTELFDGGFRPTPADPFARTVFPSMCATPLVNVPTETSELPQRTCQPPCAIRGVLVGDDDPGVRRVLELGFARAGLPVLLARDGQEVLEQYDRHADRIDAVLMDVDMPRLSGLVTLRALRAQNADLRVFLMSGVRRFTPEELDEIGATGFLPKPFRLLELVQGLLEVLNRPQRHSSAEN